MNAHTRAEALRLLDEMDKQDALEDASARTAYYEASEKLRALLSASDDVPGEIGALTTKLAAMQTSLDSDVAEALIEGWDELFDAAPAAANGWRTMESAPRDATPVDLWRHGERLTNYRRVKLAPDNVFYEPVESGYSCVRDAEYWRPLPEPPNGETK